MNSSLEKAADLSDKIGDLDAAIGFMRCLVKVNDLFETGYVQNPHAAKMNLERLLARRDKIGRAQSIGSKSAVEAQERGD